MQVEDLAEAPATGWRQRLGSAVPRMTLNRTLVSACISRKRWMAFMKAAPPTGLQSDSTVCARGSRQISMPSGTVGAALTTQASLPILWSMVDQIGAAGAPARMTFAGHVALITGAASGIGRAAARAFCAAGGAAMLVDVDASGAQHADALSADGANAAFALADVADVAAVNDAVTRTVACYGGLNIVLHAAGVVLARGVESTTLDEWSRVIDVNLKSAFFLAATTMPHLRKRAGAIVFVASMAGLAGQAGTPAYCASKGGLIALTRALAIDLAADGVRVNCVCPGSVDTPMMTRWLGDQPDPDAARQTLVARQPLGRMAQPEEIAAAMLFLASESAAFITGHALVVDGGLFMGPR